MPFPAVIIAAFAVFLATLMPSGAVEKQCIAEPMSVPAQTTTRYRLVWTPINKEDRGSKSLHCVTEDVFKAEFEKMQQERPDIHVDTVRTKSCVGYKCPKGHVPIYGNSTEVICVACGTGEYSFKEKCCIK